MWFNNQRVLFWVCNAICLVPGEGSVGASALLPRPAGPRVGICSLSPCLGAGSRFQGPPWPLKPSRITEASSHIEGPERSPSKDSRGQRGSLCASPPPAGFAAAATHPGAGPGGRGPAVRAPVCMAPDDTCPQPRPAPASSFWSETPGLQYLHLYGAWRGWGTEACRVPGG